MTDYSKLSDMEINGRVLHRLTSGHAKRIQQASVASGEIDYCNSWADAGPILFKNLIGTEPLYEFDDEDEETSGGIHPDGEWGACHVRNNGIAFRSEHSNPLRAAMIVFLMMNEGE